ncbi:MAG: hypothetical protein QM714_02170 [Nocardioides sp.]|uniref:hypothetical protein n=1 Tax=Nocardioides sp. TaxID=35761 RepID=UPI0039E4E6EF
MIQIDNDADPNMVDDEDLRIVAPPHQPSVQPRAVPVVELTKRPGVPVGYRGHQRRVRRDGHDITVAATARNGSR